MATETRRKSPNTRKADETGQVLNRLERMLRRAEVFALGFVKCNHPHQQQEMRKELATRLEDRSVLEVELDKPIVSLLDELTARWEGNNPPNIVSVYGLEKSINELQEASPVLGRLTNDRDLLRRFVPVPLLIWLPDFALDFMARGAPDFWAWRSGVYEFATETSLWQTASKPFLASNPSALSSLHLPEKITEISRIEELLRTAQSLPKQNKREKKITAGLFFQLGLLFTGLGDFENAHMNYMNCLQIGNEIKEKLIIVRSLHELAGLLQYHGREDEAIQLYLQCLTIAKEINDEITIASTLHNLGAINQRIGNFEEAFELYQQSLQIKTSLKDINGISSTLHQLGVLEQERGKLDMAEQLYQKSLTIKRQMGDRGKIASTLHMLGMVKQHQGDFAGAKVYFKESIELSKSLGDNMSLAITQAQFGFMSQTQHNYQEAIQYYVEAWELFHDLSSPYSKRTQNYIQNIRKHIGEQQFEAWLHESFPHKAAKILKALDIA